MWLIIFIIALAILFYFTGIKPIKYWEERGIPSLKPWPYLGNSFEIAFQRRAFTHIIDDTYHAFPGRRCCGFYNFTVPSLMLRDPDLIKKITVKEFESFPEHRPFVQENVDTIWSKNLFAMPGIKPIRYWKNLSVPTLSAWPYFGSTLMVKLGKRAYLHVVNDNYEAFSGRRYFGFYNMSSPVLMIRDPDLIKKITVEEFETFSEHRRVVPDGVDPFWDKNLFAMKGGKDWHNMRTTLTPAFTSSKLKMMFELMNECSKRISEHFLKQTGMVTVELKDIFTRFASDIIAATTFGATCDCLQNKDNEFYLMGKAISNCTGWRNWVLTFYSLCPPLSKIIKFRFFPKTASNFVNDLVKETIQLREEKGVIRPDIIHILKEAKKQNKMHIENEDITAQAMIFFFGGFDTLSNMICYTFYELAINPDVQERLSKEVDKALENGNGCITFEIVTKMEYLNMVIEESLRKWSPFAFIDRRATKSFTIEPRDSTEKPVQLEKGTVIVIPVYSIQRDAEYYRDPEKFDPERFSKTNKKDVNPFTYLPFGTGPRNCIGLRFALLVGKLITAEIISKFEIVPIEKTQIPLVLNKKRNNAIPTNGFWLGLRSRK